MAGEMGQRVEKLANDFNDYARRTSKSSPVYKGTYPEVDDRRDRGIPRQAGAAHRAGVRGRHRDDDGGQGRDLSGARADEGRTASRSTQRAICRRSSGYYSDMKGNMLSFPFNSSTPILYYNKDLFKKAGLDPETPPKTFDGCRGLREETAGGGRAMRLHHRVAVAACRSRTSPPITTSRSRTQENGFGRPRRRAETQRAAPGQALQNLVDWQKTKIFDYGGRGDSSQAEVLLRRMRDDGLVGRGAPRHHHQHEGSRSAWRCCPTMPT